MGLTVRTLRPGGTPSGPLKGPVNGGLRALARGDGDLGGVQDVAGLELDENSVVPGRGELGVHGQGRSAVIAVDRGFGCRWANATSLWWIAVTWA